MEISTTHVTVQTPAPVILPLPCVITIGPQCSGKTTYLKKYPGIKDISIDDVPGVYERVQMRALADDIHGIQLVPDVQVYGRKLRERVHETQSSEQGLLTKRLFGVITAEEFRNSVRMLVQTDEAYEHLCAVLDSLGNSPFEMSTLADIFIPEARNWGIRSARDRLALALRTEPTAVGWGNTNLSPREYKTALQLAFECGRPVEFACWGRDIPRLPAQELVHRNILRYIHTGKYIPVDILVGYIRRAEDLLERSFGGEPAQLALLAGFELLSNGMVRPLDPSTAYETGSPLRRRIREETSETVEAVAHTKERDSIGSQESEGHPPRVVDAPTTPGSVHVHSHTHVHTTHAEHHVHGGRAVHHTHESHTEHHTHSPHTEHSHATRV